MRILHTSDWHLGRVFHGASRRAEQAEALERIVALVRERSVELVLVAGDLFDRAVPPTDAVALLDDALVALRRAGATVVAITGNHDSAVRAGFADRLLAEAGVTIRGDVARVGEAVVVPATDGGPPVVVHPVPYLDPLAVASVLAPRPDEPADGGRRLSHHGALRLALDRVRADLAARRAAGAVRSVVVAHTFVNGGRASGSERELTVGDVDLVGLDLFDDLDYVALGHLHRSQAWDGGRVAYAGSLLADSFRRGDQPSSVRLVDLAPDGSLAVEEVALGAGRSLRTIEGDLDHLLASPDPRLVEAEAAYVRAVLTDRHLPLQAMARLQQRFPHAVELVHRPPAVPDARLRPATDPAPAAADPLDLSVRFLDERRGFPAEADERDLLRRALDDARRRDAS